MTRRHDARDERPARSKRTPGENAARLTEMADLSAMLDTAREREERHAADLVACQEERDRLRVIVDLACASFVARNSEFPFDDFSPLTEAVAAEVARRAQV